MHLLKKSEQILEVPKQTFTDFVKESMKCALDFTMTGKSIPFEAELLDYSISEDSNVNEEEEDSNMTPSEVEEEIEQTPLKTMQPSGIEGP